MATLINGTKIADTILDNLKKNISSFSSVATPCLVVILVGNRKDSSVYVKMKENAATRIGIIFRLCKLDINVTQSELESQIVAFNCDNSVHGIIVQLPLPPHLNQNTILQCVLPSKDVDGFNPINSVTNPHRLFTNCTPRGILKLLEHCNCKLNGSTIVVIGTGNVGLPLSVLLMEQNATVICCNAYTNNIQTLTRQADIVIAAAGCPQLVKKDWIKQGAIIIDVGINSIKDPSRKTGYRLVGDVDFDEVSSIASYITPVPGGVGPMTVAMLMSSVVDSFLRESVEEKCVTVFGEKELKKRDVRIAELEKELNEYKCAWCTSPRSDKYDAECSVCHRYVCDDCYDWKIIGTPFKCYPCIQAGNQDSSRTPPL